MIPSACVTPALRQGDRWSPHYVGQSVFDSHHSHLLWKDLSSIREFLVSFHSRYACKWNTKTENIDADLGQLVLQAQLQEAEAYADNFLG